MIRARRSQPFPAGARIFQRIFTRLGLRGRPPHFVVEFFPYAGLTNTIRLRRGVAHVRLSDLMRSAPLPVVEAAATLLMARVHRRKVPRKAAQAYREFCLSAKVRQKLVGLRRRRAPRVVHAPRGAHFDLEPMFARLNHRYFGGRLPRTRLSWSRRAWRCQLGCFDPALRQIVLSSRLDFPGVPDYVVEYVLFHEMLHVKHPLRRARCGLQAHSPEFRREERRYPHFDRAQKFLSRFN